MIKKIRWLISLIKPYVDKVNDDNLFAIAGHSAFFFILAVVPRFSYGVSFPIVNPVYFSSANSK